MTHQLKILTLSPSPTSTHKHNLCHPDLNIEPNQQLEFINPLLDKLEKLYKLVREFRRQNKTIKCLNNQFTIALLD